MREIKFIIAIYNRRLLLTLSFIVIALVFFGCTKNNEDSFTADFSFEYNDDNHVKFVNKSVGEYYALMWDFGNNQADTTLDKTKDQVVYYPTAGNYEVSLKLLNFTGVTETAKKTVVITNTELSVSFTAEIDPDNPNQVILKNTSEGEYDSFKWLYRNDEVENEMEHVAYFPFSGSYEIELQVLKSSGTFSVNQVVSIIHDDPNYFEQLTLVWSDEFDGQNVNTNNWTFETGASGWGNNELQNYTNGDNSEIVDGNLVITARKVNNNTQPGSYTSSRMISRSKQQFKYGRFEIRANLPSGKGIWPAIWMLGSSIGSVGWPACGEIDIMEYVGYQPNIVHATVHTTSGHGATGNGSSITLPTCEEEFHVYGLFWTEKKMVFYVDTPGNIVYTYSPLSKNEDNWPFYKPAFFILNIAVGGDWGGAQGIDNSIFPQTMEIDYVRVYQEVK